MTATDLSPVEKYTDVLKRLGDDEPSCQLETWAVIEDIKVKKGYLDENVLQDMNALKPENREILLRVVEQKRKTEALYTTSISEQLYSSKYRFLYEVIQNADDSHYDNVKSTNSQPFLRFIVTPETFVIETNEDGFNRKNVEAICATGQSSKKSSSSKEYTGEKGFGFKSVFSIANEVRIRSGLWSFKFEHQKKDNGLGMVTPLESTAVDLPTDTTTRITLCLTQQAIEDYTRLLDAVLDLPDTSLFFLRKLSTVHINLTRQDGSREVHSIKKTVLEDGAMVRIDRSLSSSSTETVASSLYYQVRHQIDGMPHDERRRDQKTVVVHLAFPVDPVTKEPQQSVIGQHVFAYLPLHRVTHLPFLIQSDFIASASRENTIDCDWNDVIRDGVAQAFTKAVKVFATADHPLRYTWLKFLPHKIMEKPWNTMYGSIAESIKAIPVFETWEQRRFRKPTELRLLHSSCLHDGHPILKDTPDELYLAPDYGRFASPKILQDLGIRFLNWKDVLLRIRTDVTTPSSRIKSQSLDSPWFEAFAGLCTSILELLQMSDSKNLLKKQPLIPLSSPNQWTGAPGMGQGGLPNIYFPCTDTIPIPKDIGLYLLNQDALAKPKVKRFFAALGVEDCSKELVFAKIRAAHSSRQEGYDFGSHLRYLFHNHDTPSDLRKWLLVPTDIGPKDSVSGWKFYFPSDAPYDMENLLSREIRLKNKTQYGVIPVDVLDLEPTEISVKGRTWKTWLQEATGALHHPSLVRKIHSETTLSRGLAYILDFNPGKFLGTLKAHWSEYQRDVSRVKSTLMECEVLCRSGHNVSLCETYLPTLAVLGKLQELSVSDASVSVLYIPDGDLDDDLHREWRFLEDFGVRSNPDLRFYKSVLLIMSSAKDIGTRQTCSLYASMAKLATVEDHSELRTFFSERPRILGGGSDWVSPDNCVWRGPDFLRHTTVLEKCYPEDIYTENLFSKILNIKNTTFETVLNELLLWAQESPSSYNPSDTQKAYEYISSNAKTDEELKTMRSAFRAKALVLDRSSRWHTLQTCYWSSPSPLAGYVDLQSTYPDLEDFFVRQMRVKKASPAMLIREVKKMAEQNDPKAKAIRDRLIEVGTILAKDNLDEDAGKALQELQSVKFLPRRSVDGSLALVGVEDDFAILDHVRYGLALAEKGILLDFDVSETQLLHLMIQKLGLASRYLSTAVSEQSSAGDESVRHPMLTRQLHARAYALYCCAAKHKSRKALRDDGALFDLLTRLDVYTTDTITTDLVLDLKDGPLIVPSDRPLIHHVIADGTLKIYVPKDIQGRRACRRSQLPRLLASIIGSGPAAVYDVSSILSCGIDELDDILVEHDITDVSWITRPDLDVRELRADERSMIKEDRAERDVTNAVPSVTRSERETSTSSASASSRSRATPVPVTTNDDRATRGSDVITLETQTILAQQSQYRELLDRLISIANRSISDVIRTFDNRLTFGDRGTDDLTYNRRIGAAGEAFVFEWLSALDLPQFSIENWQSTIRGEVGVHPRYTDLRDWRGRETADLVYLDNTGRLSNSLREHCTGSFPSQIATDHDHALNPIEYYLEVKSTPGQRSARFYMSGGQYNRMEKMARGLLQGHMQVYVLMRVSSLTAADVKLDIFVDPFRFQNNLLRFETEQWNVNIQ